MLYQNFFWLEIMVFFMFLILFLGGIVKLGRNHIHIFIYNNQGLILNPPLKYFKVSTEETTKIYLNDSEIEMICL